MAEWFVVRKGKEHGPFQDAQLKSLATSGKLKEDDQVRRSDQKSTVAAKSIGGLFGLALSPESLPPAPAPAPAAAPRKSGIWMKVLYFLMFCMMVGQVLKMIGLMRGSKNNQRAVSKEVTEKDSDNVTAPIQERTSLAHGRPKAATFLTWLREKNGVRFDTPPEGSSAEGTKFAVLAPTPGAACRIHIGSKQGYGALVSIIIVEDETSKEISGVIAGIPFSINGKSDIGPLNEFVWSVLPECEVRHLIRDNALAITSGQSATKQFGKASISITHSGREMRATISVDE